MLLLDTEGHGLDGAFISLMKTESSKIHRSCATVLVKPPDRSVLFRKVSLFLESNLSLSLQIRRVSTAFESEDTTLFHLWNFIVCLVFALQMTTVPYSIAFNQRNETIFHVVIDAIACVVFCVDMFINRNTIILQDGNILNSGTNINVTSTARVGWCKVISTLPVSLIVYGVTVRTHRGDLLLYAFTRLLGFFRIVDISSILSGAWKAVKHIFGVNIYGNVLHLVVMMSFYLYVAHVLACVYCFLGFQEMKMTSARNDGAMSSWIEANDLQNRPSFEIYLQSYYWALYSLSSVGYGNIAVASNTERVFAILVMIVGSMTVSYQSSVLNLINFMQCFLFIVFPFFFVCLLQCAGLLATIESMIQLQDDASGKMRYETLLRKFLYHGISLYLHEYIGEFSKQPKSSVSHMKDGLTSILPAKWTSISVISHWMQTMLWRIRTSHFCRLHFESISY